MTALTIRPIESNEYDTWDEFVSSSRHGTLYHTSIWKRVIDRCNAPARLVLIGCFDDFTLCGGCVVLDREKFGQRTAVTPLVTPYCGFLLETPVGEKLSDQVSRETDIVLALAAYLADKYPYQNLINPPHLEDTRPLQKAGYTLTPRFTYLLNLKLPADEIWQRFDGSVRRQIKKAERIGYEISEVVDADEAFALLEATFQKHGEQCPIARQVFDEIVYSEELADCRQVLAAHEQDRLAAYIILLKFQRTIYYALAAADQDALTTGVSSLLIWEVIKAHACEAWNCLDFVGANIPSIARFKEGFNPRLQLHFQSEFMGDPIVRVGKTVMDLLRR